MLNFALLLFLVSPVAFLAGLINPKWVLRGEKRTRLKSSLVYSGVFVGSVLTIGLTAPPQAKNASVPNPSVGASPVVAPSPQSTPKAAKQVSFTSSSAKPVGDVGQTTAPNVASSSAKPQAESVTAHEATNWSDELCHDQRYFPANGASLAAWNSCQYINSNSLKAESIILATAKDSENVADSMIDKGFQKVSWEDDFNPLTEQSRSACIVYSDKSVACHKGEGTNLSSHELTQSTVETASPIVGPRTAVVVDPPSNVRATPNGDVICSLGDRSIIKIYDSIGSWYHTDACNRMGVIHSSQIIVADAGSEATQPSPEPSSDPSPTYTTSTYTTPTYTSTGGNCNSPDDLDSRGHRCGGRAASVRAGGRGRRR